MSGNKLEMVTEMIRVDFTDSFHNAIVKFQKLCLRLLCGFVKRIIPCNPRLTFIMSGDLLPKLYYPVLVV